jgi:hypothetical protein
MFTSGIEALKRTRDGRVDADIEFQGETDFVAEVFVDGSSKCTCHVWIGNLVSRDGISYFEGRSVSNDAINELLSIADDGQQLFLSASMGQIFCSERGRGYKAHVTGARCGLSVAALHHTFGAQLVQFH